MGLYITRPDPWAQLTKGIPLWCQSLRHTWIWKLFIKKRRYSSFFSAGVLYPVHPPMLTLRFIGNWGTQLHFQLCPRINGNEYGAAFPPKPQSAPSCQHLGGQGTCSALAGQFQPWAATREEQKKLQKRRWMFLVDNESSIHLRGDGKTQD